MLTEETEWDHGKRNEVKGSVKNHPRVNGLSVPIKGQQRVECLRKARGLNYTLPPRTQNTGEVLRNQYIDELQII